MRNLELERTNVQLVLDGLNKRYPGWEIVLFDDEWLQSWFCKRPFRIDGIHLYFDCDEKTSHVTNAWIPQFKHALGSNNNGLYSAYEALINNKLLRFTKTMRSETMANRLLTLMPEYERILGIANDVHVDYLAKRQRTHDTLRSVLPAQYRESKINEYHRCIEIDLGCDREDHREVRWRELKVQEYEGRISELRITYPDPSIIEAIIELVLAAMPPIPQKTEGDSA